MNAKKPCPPDGITWMYGLVACVFWSLAVVGAFQAHSPVPFWDMWDGYLGFYTRVNSGDWSAWLAQHNEHRILLSRVFFWMDLQWFAGTGQFLLAVNYFLLAVICWVFWNALKESCKRDHHVLGLSLVIWLSSWSQENNLTWGFQSQFMLAQLLPLTAFLMLHRASDTPKSAARYFAVACFLGVLSLGSMANGVLTLPLMVMLGLVLNIRKRNLSVLIMLSGLCGLAYFYDYRSPSGHGSLLTALQENPLGLLSYLLLYLGGPFFYIFGHKAFAMVAGVTLILTSAYLAWHALRVKSSQTSLTLALLTFILYVGGTALATAGGRLIFGTGQALSSRYMTPSLMAWAALLVILAPPLVNLARPNRARVWGGVLVCITVTLLPTQLKALQSRKTELFERRVAALALEMRVLDDQQIGTVFPSGQWAMSLAAKPSEENISVFGHAWIRDVRELIGKQLGMTDIPQHACEGHLDVVERVKGDDQHVRVVGWMFDRTRNQAPQTAWIVDRNRQVVGFVLLGMPRPDVAQAINAAAGLAGFKGYMSTQAAAEPLLFFDPVGKCAMSSNRVSL